MAQEVAPAERARFLARLESRPQPDEEQIPAGELDNELLERIRELKEDILARQEAIEDGTYDEDYDDSDYRGYGGYYDEEIEAISDEQREECANLFAGADHLFLAQELDVARRAYRSLLSRNYPSPRKVSLSHGSMTFDELVVPFVEVLDG